MKMPITLNDRERERRGGEGSRRNEWHSGWSRSGRKGRGRRWWISLPRGYVIERAACVHTQYLRRISLCSPAAGPRRPIWSLLWCLCERNARKGGSFFEFLSLPSSPPPSISVGATERRGPRTSFEIDGGPPPPLRGSLLDRSIASITPPLRGGTTRTECSIGITKDRYWFNGLAHGVW